MSVMPAGLATRRGVLRIGVGIALAGCAPAAARPRVAIARDPALRAQGGSPDGARLLQVLDRTVQSATATESPGAAWKALARPDETIGLKINCLAGKGSSTTPALVEAVIERLRQAGLPARNIVVWDRLNADFEHAGFPVGTRRDGIRFIGNDEAGYESGLSIFGSAGSVLSKTLTRTCDGYINLPVLKDHGIVGVTMALKNMFGAIHNPNKYHSNGGDPYVADVNALPAIRNKMRITICDAVSPQYEGGPSYMPHWAWPFNGVIVSRDPVALDAVGWRIIEEQRAAHGLPTLRAAKREPAYIARAADAQHKLGIADPALIEKVEV
jgi:uncharacterized protein (DUF362 family)